MRLSTTIYIDIQGSSKSQLRNTPDLKYYKNEIHKNGLFSQELVQQVPNSELIFNVFPANIEKKNQKNKESGAHFLIKSPQHCISFHHINVGWAFTSTEEEEIGRTVRKILTDCSILITHLSSDELSGGSRPPPLPPLSGEVFTGNDSSTTTFSSLSCKTVARTRHDFLANHKENESFH